MPPQRKWGFHQLNPKCLLSYNAVERFCVVAYIQKLNPYPVIYTNPFKMYVGSELEVMVEGSV
jgi:hypothetical protein